MRLTPPLPLLPHSWTQADIDEIAHVVQSTANSSAIAELRYGTVPPAEAKEYFRAVVGAEIGEWSEKGTIREGEGVGAGGDKKPAGEGDRREEADRYEVLVVRDLDWPRQYDQQQQNSNIAPEGTIVAYCVHRYNAARDHLDFPATSSASHSPPPSFPKSGNAPSPCPLQHHRRASPGPDLPHAPRPPNLRSSRTLHFIPDIPAEGDSEGIGGMGIWARGQR